MRDLAIRMLRALWPGWSLPREARELDEFEREATDAISTELQHGHSLADTRSRHRDDLPWWRATHPWPWHHCVSQTVGYLTKSGIIYRCACGGIRGEPPHDMWHDRNRSA